jgi:hypothetical protein
MVLVVVPPPRGPVPGQWTGVRWRIVSSRYGEFVVGLMNGLVDDGQPV